uniref:dapper homolog 3-like n=1 Tax=Macaca mulatta TaxID=9544 RepID=UPI0010A235DD|nr:dapper homolog 3-like [Macaca mulatta]
MAEAERPLCGTAWGRRTAGGAYFTGAPVLEGIPKPLAAGRRAGPESPPGLREGAAHLFNTWGAAAGPQLISPPPAGSARPARAAPPGAAGEADSARVRRAGRWRLAPRSDRFGAGRPQPPPFRALREATRVRRARRAREGSAPGHAGLARRAGAPARGGGARPDPTRPSPRGWLGGPRAASAQGSLTGEPRGLRTALSTSPGWEGTLDVTPVHENGRGQSCPRGRPATSRQGPHGQNPARATKVPDESGSVSCKGMHLLLWLQERTEMHKEEQCEEEEALIPRPTKARTPLHPAPSAHVPPRSLPPCPGARLKGMLKEIKPR